MNKEIYISIDCYKCGTKMEFPFRLGVQQAEYAYCNYCREGVQVTFFNNVLNIDRLEGE